MGFSDESISRNPAADLDGGTFFRLSDSSDSRVGTLFFSLPGGRSTLMAGSSELCKSACTLKSGRTLTACDVWRVLGTVIPHQTARGEAAGSKRRGPAFAGCVPRT